MASTKEGAYIRRTSNYAWNAHFGAYLFCRTSVHKSCLKVITLPDSHVERIQSSFLNTCASPAQTWFAQLYF